MTNRERLCLLLPLVVASFALSLVFLACGPRTPPTRVVQTKTIRPPAPGKAQLVFVRPHRVGDRSPNVTLWDGTRPLVSLALSQTFQVDLDPGRHQLVALTHGADVIDANLVAGKTYYVYLWLTTYMHHTVVHLNPLHPNHKHWKDKDRWIKQSRFVEVIPKNIPLWSKRHRPRAAEALKKYDPKGDAAKRAIHANYGI